MKEKKENVPAFISLLEVLQEISNESYQHHQWIAREDPKDYGCYENTIMYFLEDGEAIINARDAGRVYMTDSQYKMLKKLYGMVDQYDDNKSELTSDREIVNDPKWHEIREYAKLVYVELIKT